MSPRVETDREHVIIQSVGVAIYLDRDQLRNVPEDDLAALLDDLGETTLDTWRTEIAGSDRADDRRVIANGGEQA